MSVLSLYLPWRLWISHLYSIFYLKQYRQTLLGSLAKHNGIISFLKCHYQISNSWTTFFMFCVVSIIIGIYFEFLTPKLSPKSVNLKVRILSFICVQTVYFLVQLVIREWRIYLMVDMCKEKQEYTFRVLYAVSLIPSWSSYTVSACYAWVLVRSHLGEAEGQQVIFLRWFYCGLWTEMHEPLQARPKGHCLRIGSCYWYAFPVIIKLM